MSCLAILPGERLYPRSLETVRLYNQRVGTEVLTWHQFRMGINPGTKTSAGRVRIPTRRYGRRLFVSLEGIDRWAHEAAAGDAGDHQIPVVRQAKKRLTKSTVGSSKARVANAERFLQKEGL